MSSVSCEDLIHALRESGLHDEPQLAVIERELADIDDDPQAFVRHLVLNGHASLYQIKKIINSKSADLFVGPFVVVDKLGEGGMGKVYKVVTWKKPDQFLALKVVRGHLLANPVIKRRYEREVHAATSLRHTNIVSVYDSGECEGKYYLAMEFVDGIDLAKVVRDYEHLHVPEACEYVRQAALGLHHAHESGFVHRDVKPSNILVCGERHVPEATGPSFVKLLDMGLVRAAGFDETQERTDLTRLGTVVGTPDYMAPEQARNSSTVDARADIYSLGCTLFYLLTGRPPFPDGTPIEKLFKHQLEPAPLVRDYRPDVPDRLCRLIDQLMSKSPEGRPDDALTVAKLLEPFARYDFRPSRGPAEMMNNRLPSAPTAARATASGYYSLADDASHMGAGDPPPRPGSSAHDALEPQDADSGVLVGNPTPTSMPSTNRLPKRFAASAANLHRPTTTRTIRKKKNRSRRRRKTRLMWMRIAWAIGLLFLVAVVWLIIRNIK